MLVYVAVFQKCAEQMISSAAALLHKAKIGCKLVSLN